MCPAGTLGCNITDLRPAVFLIDPDKINVEYSYQRSFLKAANLVQRNGNIITHKNGEVTDFLETITSL